MIKETNQTIIKDLGIKVRAIMGVPEVLLPDEVIASPIFINKSEKYVENYLKEYKDSKFDDNTLTIAQIYYICYLLLHNQVRLWQPLLFYLLYLLLVL